jgi:short-subunit dehydrogenase
MRSKRSGLIVNISSMGGLIALPFQGFDCASKYALEALTEALRMEVKPYGVQVTLIEPGDFNTHYDKPRCCGSLIKGL